MDGKEEKEEENKENEEPENPTQADAALIQQAVSLATKALKPVPPSTTTNTKASSTSPFVFPTTSPRLVLRPLPIPPSLIFPDNSLEAIYPPSPKRKCLKWIKCEENEGLCSKKLLASHQGIVIKSGDSEKKEKKQEEEEDKEELEEDDDDDDDKVVDADEGILKNYKAVIRKSGYCTMKELVEINKKLIEDQKIIHHDRRLELQGKIYRMLHKGYDKIFRDYHKDAKEPKISFYEWVQLELVGDDFPQLGELKSDTVGLGKNMSIAVLNLMFLMSQNKWEEMGKKFAAFEDALVCVNKDEEDSSTVVIRRIIDLIKGVENQQRRIRARSKGKTKITDDEEDYLKESFLDKILFMLLEEILKLEHFWVYKRFTFSKTSVIEAIPTLKGELRCFEISIEGIEDEIETSEKDGKFGVVDVGFKESDDYVDVVVYIDKLWDDLLGLQGNDQKDQEDGGDEFA